MGIDRNVFLFYRVFVFSMHKYKMLLLQMKSNGVVLSTQMKILTRKIFLKFYSASQGNL